MYLKRLDVVGFKSFANRSSLTFEPGITVLCGPNGSGKSNVADAVRWALGEQSAKAIRGRRGEDVVFVGSQGRQPLGLAEVSLTLDNSDARIPLEYDEVRITRRFYRSGEAEYLVNGSRVRLRDVHNWLLHAALDPHSYVVVGQGSVDELILQRADERRVVLENAADIRRHQAKVSETRGRLATAEENLDRCRAVIAELEPHVRRLRSQAERAGRYRDCRTELTALAASWFLHTIESARAELDQARAATSSARVRVDEVEEAQAELDRAARVASQAARELDEGLGREEASSMQIQSRHSHLEQLIAVARERERAGRDGSEALRLEAESLEPRIVELRTELTAIEARLDAAQTDLLTAMEPTTEEAETATAERALREAEEELSDLGRHDSRLDVEAQLGERVVLEGERSLEALSSRLDHAVDELASAESQLATAEREAASLSVEADQAQKEAEEQRAEQDRLSAERERVRRRMDQLWSEHHLLSGELQRLEITRVALDERSSEGSGVGLILDSGLAGIRGMLGGQLRVPRDLRRAIGAALADSAQAIVVESADSAKAGLDLVSTRSADRVGLVPIDEVAEAPPLDVALTFKSKARDLLAGLAVRGFADELVGSDVALDLVRVRCLALVVVVSDLETAREAARRFSSDGTAHAPWQVVTVDGQVIRWNGEWRGGRDRGVERLVGRQVELSDLDSTATDVATRLARLEGSLAELEEERAQIAQADSTLRTLLAQVEQQERQASLDAQAARSRFGLLQRALEQLREAEPEVRKESARVEHDVAVARTRLEEIGAERVELAGQIAHTHERNRSLRANWEGARATEAERRTEVAVRRASVETHEQMVARVRGELAAADGVGADLARRIEAHEESARTESTRSRELLSELASVASELTTAQMSVADLRDRLRTINRERAAEEERVIMLRAAARARHAELEQATIEEARAGDRLDRSTRESHEWLEELGLSEWPVGTDGRRSTIVESGAGLESAKRRMGALRRELRAIGSIDEATLAEFEELRGRHEFLTTQTADLEKAVRELRVTMDELQTMMRGAFEEAFARVNEWFGDYFARLFGGGHAELVLSDADDVLESGVDIVARPPGKRLQPLVSLSGGERALTMVALIFALLKTNPAPFCVLDEVDAALDDANITRFTQMLRELSERTQFIVVSHNRGTMEIAKALYGVTMDSIGVSHAISLRLAEASSAG